MPERVLSSGTNGGDVSEAVFFAAVRKFDEITSAEMAVKKRWKEFWDRAEDDGIVKVDFKATMKENKKPIEERIKSLNRRAMYKRFFKHAEAAKMPVLDMQSETTGLTEAEHNKKWEDQGYVAGSTGKNRADCPHDDPNSLAARHWMEGYDLGQASIAPKKGPKKDAAAAPASEAPAAPKPPASGPKHESEVEEAGKKRGRPAGKKGVTYWHNAELRKVYEVSTADANPEGAVAITKAEHDKLKAEYSAAEAAAWNEAGGANGSGAAAKPIPVDDFDADPPAAPKPPAPPAA